MRNLGHPADSRPKGTEDHSLPEKRETEEVSESVDPPDPRGKAKAGSLEVHSRSVHASTRHSADST